MTRHLPSKRALYRALSVLGAALAVGSCLSATEIRLHVHTNVPCTDASHWKGIAVYAGTPNASLEGKAPTLTSTTCDSTGQVGTLVVVPSGAKDEELGLRVVGGLTRNPEDCAAHGYAGCIVARRTLRFNPHQALDLDVELTSQCVGLGCDAAHTCIEGTCSETRSVLPGVLPAAGPDLANQPKVRCGDNGVFCPTSGNVCCLTVDRDAGTSTGECKPSTDCGRGSIVLNCDDQTDCASKNDDAGRLGVCSVAYTLGANVRTPFIPGTVVLAECHSYTELIVAYGRALGLCQTRLPCGNQGQYPCYESEGVPTNPLPGYYTCDIPRE